MTLFHFSFGDSESGVVSLTASVRAKTPEEAAVP